MAREAIKQFSRREPDEAVLEQLLDEVRYVPGTFDDAAVYETLSDDARRVRQGRRHADEPLLLPLDRADVLPGHRAASSASKALPSTRAPTCAW